jgi:hypothetical protein
LPQNFGIRTGSAGLPLEKDHKLPNLLYQTQPKRVKCGTFYQTNASRDRANSGTIPNKYLRKDSLLDNIV